MTQIARAKMPMWIAPYTLVRIRIASNQTQPERRSIRVQLTEGIVRQYHRLGLPVPVPFDKGKPATTTALLRAQSELFELQRAKIEEDDLKETERAAASKAARTQAFRASRGDKGRRKRCFWNDAEVRALEEGVRKWGVGAWQKILTDNKPIFISTRTGVDLKDKWVNIQKFANRN